ncbi:S-methyl-5'-thioadenosine phosphorylase [soil metagenome]
MSDVRIGIIGGSGLYELVEGEPQDVATPYGLARVTVGELAGRRVAFLARHGAGHALPPHRINYRANIWALASLGVRAIVSSSAVGGVTADYPPGTLALPDQYLDRTQGRADTFFDGAAFDGAAFEVTATSVQHLASADPFDPALRAIATSAVSGVVPTGTIVVIQGPRFSTRAESRWFASAGANLVTMTLYPEVPLAAELNIGTVNLSFVTDADAGLSDPGAEEVSGALVFRRLREAQPRIIAAISAIVSAIPQDFEGRELIDRAVVAEVLGRRVATTGVGS